MPRIVLIVLLAVGVALILGAGALVFFNGGLSFGPAETPTPVPTIVVAADEPTPVATTDINQAFVQVVVSLQTVPRGYLMTSDVLTLETRLADQVPLDAVYRVEDAVGLYARNDIYQGETIVRNSLVRDVTLDGQQEYGPSSLIPPGYVAMSVPADRLGTVGYGVAPGDFVDILVTFLLFSIDEEFQTRLPNSANFYMEQLVPSEGTDENGNPIVMPVPVIYTISPYGRFERLPDGNIGHVTPSETESRGVHVAFLIQNAKVIQVGPWLPPSAAQPPTPTPDPNAAEEQPVVPTPTALFFTEIDSILLALPPQQQLFLKYSVESNSVIDYALRGINDGQLYPVENVTLDYLLQRFNVEIPPDFTYIAYPSASVFYSNPLPPVEGVPGLIATTTIPAEYYFVPAEEEQP